MANFYFLFYKASGAAAEVKLIATAPQCELKGHATPFVNGTRSTTDGLKDLSGQANHADLSNATYDSNANLFYDGTGYINFSNAQVVGATEGTISA